MDVEEELVEPVKPDFSKLFLDLEDPARLEPETDALPDMPTDMVSYFFTLVVCKLYFSLVLSVVLG
jgi:hypothetical protein